MKNPPRRKSAEPKYKPTNKGYIPGMSVETFRRNTENLYIDGTLDPSRALRRLELSSADPNARLIAGEIALEQAHQAGTIDEVAQLMSRAKHNFELAISLSKKGGEMARVDKARAQFNLAQLPNHLAIVANGTLPPISTSQKSYEATLEFGQALRHDFRNISKNNKSVETRHLAGLLGEAAVLLLGQRYAIESVADSSWLPMHALYSADNANLQVGDCNRAWDIEVLSDLGQGIKTDSRIQVKTTVSPSLLDAQRREDAEGILRLHVQPDLKLPYEQYIAASEIIRQCASIYENPGEVCMQRTDERTELLLDFIDQ